MPVPLRTRALVLGIAISLLSFLPGAMPSAAQQADPQAQLDTVLSQKSEWQRRLDQARSMIDRSTQSLNTAKAKLDQTKASLTNTQATLASLQATAPQQIDQLQHDLAGAQAELDTIVKDNTERQNKLISDLGANQQLIDESQAQLEATTRQIDYVHQQIEQLDRDIAQRNEDIAATQQQLGIFLRLTYKEQRRSMLEFFLESISFGDFLARVSAVQSVATQENHLLTLLNDQRQQLLDAQTEEQAQLAKLQDLQDTQQVQKQTLDLQRQYQQQQLEQARVEAQEANDRIGQREAQLQALIDHKQGQLDANQQLLQNLKSAQVQLSSTINNQTDTLAKAQQDEQLARTQLDRLEREAEGIAAIINRAEASKPTKTYASGRLAWPLQGALTQGFGPTSYWFEPSITYHGVRYRHFHTGIDIAASYGTPIRAAADGQVIATGYSPWGYGNHLIIAHNPTLATLYAHLSRLAVGNGAIVKQGQIIGYEGSTGNSTGPHLHFEVRVNGDFVDPFSYL